MLVPVNYSGTTALITGASSGLGEEFARQLAARGADLVLVARRLDRLEALAADLRSMTGRTVTVIAADLAAPDAAANLARTLEKKGLTISTLVNNAGFGTRNRFENEQPERIAEEIDLNIGVLVDLTKVFYDQLRANDRGALITVASTAAYQPVPLMAVYGASKAFVLSFTEALWYENRGRGLKVLCLSPGATKTEFFEVAGEGARIGDFQTPEEVVGLALSTLDKRNAPPSVISGARNKAMAWSGRLVTRKTLVTVSGNLTQRNPV
jgi:short-subunit dehydrogenase